MDFGVVGFREPLWLVVGLAAVAAVWIGTASRSALSPQRRWTVFAIRSLVVLLAAAALAEVEWIRTTDRVAVIFLLDQSRSVPAPARAAQTAYVNEAMAKRRPHDLAGAIVFGGRAEVETPPWDHSWRLDESLDRTRFVDPDQTDLEAAVKLAAASFPPDAARRIVLVCDGLENRGQALPLAEAAAAQGVGFDVVEVGRTATSDVLVESVQAPSVVRERQPFDVRIVVDHAAASPTAGVVRGRLVASVRVAGKTVVLNPDADSPLARGGQRVELPPGKTPLVLSTSLERAGMYPFRVEFTPDPGSPDEFLENNAATTLVDVPGAARVLLVEREPEDDEPAVEDHRAFADRLRRQGLEVDERPASSAFQSLIDLQPYDCVVLGDVPRDQLTDGQVSALVRNVHDSGGGLLMLGGPHSLGAGGWAGSELEKASPVDFQIENAVVAPVGALQLVIDRSGSMQGDKMTWAKAAAIAAVEVLGERDTVSVVSFDSQAQWNARPTTLANRDAVLRAIRKIEAGGGTNLWPAMTEARQALRGVNAAVKHMIVLTDGQTEPNDFAGLAERLRGEKVTVTTVAVGPDADVKLLQAIAARGGGKFYRARNGSMLPRIFQTEARRVARPLIYENEAGLPPTLVARSEALSGVSAVPPVLGYVLSSRKESSLVETLLEAPLPENAEPKHRTLLAQWRYGLGRSAVLATDVGTRWAAGWSEWPDYDRFFAQLVRSIMRPSGDAGRYALGTQRRDGKIEIVVDANDAETGFVNFQTMTAVVSGAGKPDAERVRLQQTSPGRYVGEFAAEEPGDYVVSVLPAPDAAILRTGASIPYSDEFRPSPPNRPLLTTLAGLTPDGGSPGVFRTATDAASVSREELTRELERLASENDAFRRDLRVATTRLPGWHWTLLAAACLFFLDVGARRVWFDAEAVRGLFARFFAPRAESTTEPGDYFARLQQRKSEAAREAESQRTRFELDPAADAGARSRFREPLPSERTFDEVRAAAPEPNRETAERTPPSLSPTPEGEAEDYASRLLKAKRAALRRRDEEPGRPA